MPYQRSLQQYVQPEMYAEAPDTWERRLREISPDLGLIDRLIFRKFNPTEPDGEDRGWLHKDRPIWVLYSAKPKEAIKKERAEDFAKHWSELATEGERVAMRSDISSYRHFMWHARGLYVRPFLILQGQFGGTPAVYTPQETAFLKASDCLYEPFPIGTFPACQFDEGVVKMIVNRDRLLKVANRHEELERMDTPEGREAERKAALLLERQTYLDTWRVMIEPQADFFAHWMKRSEHRDQLPPAPPSVEENVGKWRDHFLEHGHVLGTSPASQRQIRTSRDLFYQ